ncbi:MAG: hypothetical protein V3U27_00795, partial [Candidatus Tectomicrobia bacterium]
MPRSSTPVVVHELPLSFIESAGLDQDVVGRANLPQIVEQGAPIEALEIPVVDAGSSAEQGREQG